MEVYEDGGFARIARLQQQDLERYHREIDLQRRIVRMRRPVQRFDMLVPVYYQRFCAWKEDMISVGCTDDESSYIDYFIGDLQWHIRLRLLERRSSMSRLIDAYHEAHHHEVMIRMDELIKDFRAANVIDEMASQTTIEIQGDHDVCDSVEAESRENNKLAEPYVEYLEEKVDEPSAHKLFDDMPRLPSIEQKEENVEADGAGVRVFVKNGDAVALDGQQADDVLKVNELPDSDEIQSNESAVKSAELLLPNTFVKDEETEPNEGHKGASGVVFYSINRQLFIGSSSVTTMIVPNNGSTKAWIEESMSGLFIVSSHNETFYVEHKLLDERFQSIEASLIDEQGIPQANECYWDNKMLLLDPGGRACSLKVWCLRSYFIFYCGGFLDKNSWKVITNNVATFLVDFNYKHDDGFGLKMILTFIFDPGGSFWHSVGCDSINVERMNAEAVVVKYVYEAGDISSKHGSVKVLHWGKVVGGSESNSVRCPFMEQGKVTDPNRSQYIAILQNEHNDTVNDLIETFCAMRREETLLFLHMLKHGVDNRLLSFETLDVIGDKITLSKCWSFLLDLSGNSFAWRTWNLRKELSLSWGRLFTNTGQYIDYIVEFEVPAAPRLYFLKIDSWSMRTIIGHATYVCSFFMRGAIAVYLPSYVPSTLSFVLVIVQT